MPFDNLDRANNSRYHAPVDSPDSTRAALLSAAVEVFAERGYEGAGVAEIARRAGLTTGAIYSRYTGKAELLLDAIEQHMPEEISHLLRGGSGNESTVELLSAVGVHLVDETNPAEGLLLEAVVAARRSPDLAEMVRHRLALEDAELAKLIDHGKDEGQIDPELDTSAVVRLCQAIGLGMHLYGAIGAEMPNPADWAAVVERLLLAAKPPEPI